MDVQCIADYTLTCVCPNLLILLHSRSAYTDQQIDLNSEVQIIYFAVPLTIHNEKIVRWCSDGDFCIIFASCISCEPRAAHFRPAF